MKIVQPVYEWRYEFLIQNTNLLTKKYFTNKKELIKFYPNMGEAISNATKVKSTKRIKK